MSCSISSECQTCSFTEILVLVKRYQLFNQALSCGSVAEWSKALVLGTSHFDGVGSNPTTAIIFSSNSSDILYYVLETLMLNTECHHVLYM